MMKGSAGGASLPQEFGVELQMLSGTETSREPSHSSFDASPVHSSSPVYHDGHLLKSTLEQTLGG